MTIDRNLLLRASFFLEQRASELHTKYATNLITWKSIEHLYNEHMSIAAELRREAGE